MSAAGDPYYDVPRPMESAIARAVAAGVVGSKPGAEYVLLMDRDRVRSRAASLLAAFDGEGEASRLRRGASVASPSPRFLHAFALKANPLRAVLNEVRESGMGAECASIAEVEQALRCGFAPHRIVMDSPCKTVTEIVRCLEAGVYMNLDSLDEVRRVADLIEEAQARAPGGDVAVSPDASTPWWDTLEAGLRVNPAVGIGSIESTSTAGSTSKFGTCLSTYGDEVTAAFLKYPWLTGLHVHVGSQGCDSALTVAGVKVVAALAQQINAALAVSDDGRATPTVTVPAVAPSTDTGVSEGSNIAAGAGDDVAASVVVSVGSTGVSMPPASGRRGARRVTTIDIGGGLSTTYHGGYDDEPTFDLYAAALARDVPSLFDGTFDRVITEFGRSIVAKAGTIVSIVEAVKMSGGRPIAVTHVGANIAPRACLAPHVWRHHVAVFGKDGTPKSVDGDLVETDVAGPLCFSGDVIARQRRLPRIEAGDMVAVMDAGGYTLSMYSRYCSRGAPAVYGFSHGAEKGAGVERGGECRLELWRAAETLEDTLRMWG